MKQLNVDPEINKFVYKSDEPCVLPQKPARTSGSKTGTTGGTTGTQLGTTGTQLGKTGGEEGRIFVLKYYCSIVTCRRHYFWVYGQTSVRYTLKNQCDVKTCFD
jgi:hypothetical protein